MNPTGVNKSLLSPPNNPPEDPPNPLSPAPLPRSNPLKMSQSKISMAKSKLIDLKLALTLISKLKWNELYTILLVIMLYICLLPKHFICVTQDIFEK